MNNRLKVGLALSLLITLPVFLTAQTKDEEKERQRVAASKIKKTVQWTHRYNQDKPNPTGYKTTETTFDKSGNPVEIINYRANGDISSKLLYKYNNKNQRIEYLMYQKEQGAKDLKLSYKQSFHYNEAGQKTHEVVFDGVAGYRITYSYMPDGSNKEIIKYNPSNAIAEKWVYEYDGFNHEIKVYNADGQITSVVKKKVDSRGNVLDETRFGANNKEQRRVINVYDDKSRLIEMSEFFSGAFSKKMYYKYSDLGVVTEIIQQNPDGQKFTQSNYKHDAKGNVLEERWSEGDTGELSHKQAKYDKNGNVLEVDSYYAPYKYRVLYKYTYEFF